MPDSERYRTLWAQVVLQAKDDLETEEYGSRRYDEAESFFLASGQWAESRGLIATMIDLHVDDITRLGRATIAARRAAEGLPPLPDPAKRPPAPIPQLVATPAPPVEPTPAAPNASRRRHIYGGLAVNPFARRFVP